MLNIHILEQAAQGRSGSQHPWKCSRNVQMLQSDMVWSSHRHGLMAGLDDFIGLSDLYDSMIHSMILWKSGKLISTVTVMNEHFIYGYVWLLLCFFFEDFFFVGEGMEERWERILNLNSVIISQCCFQLTFWCNLLALVPIHLSSEGWEQNDSIVWRFTGSEWRLEGTYH